ncbi:MAG: DUF4386 domain-containing protein [Bacteroidota bacterium]
MKNYITTLPSRKAAMLVGMAFISSVFLVTIVDDFLLANFVVPGDIQALANDIKANRKFFAFAVIGYLIVLALDSIIAVALYVVLKPASKYLATLTAWLRLLYALVLVVGVLALALQMVDVDNYASIKLVGYVFFALHIFLLGYTAFKSGYMPKVLGLLLMLTAFTYTVFFIDFNLSASLMVSIMLIMALAELSLSIWLMVKRKSLPENNG